MSEGRTFEEVDRMTWHDVVMISRWRQKSPPVDLLLRAIAEYLGIKFTDSPSALHTPIREIDPSTLHDPTEEIRKSLANATFPDGIGKLIVPERPKYG